VGGLGARQGLLVVGSGQKYYRNILIIVKSASCFNAVHGALQPYIHQHKGRSFVPDGTHGLFRRPSRTGKIITQAAEAFCGDFGDLRIVLNEKDSFHRCDTSLCREHADLAWIHGAYLTYRLEI
jgi:hypothetical protein